MGILISRFRKKPSTKELLENIDKELDDIDDFKFHTQQQQKRLIGSLIIYSIVTYIIAAVIFYLYYFPSELSKQILYSLPLIAFPVIVWLIKQLLHWYFRYKLSQNEDQIILLLRERKKLLKEVKEKETYIVAKEILDKYDPEQIQNKLNIYSAASSNAPDILAKLPEIELRKRAAAVAAVKALPKVPLRPLGSALPGVSNRPMPSSIKPGYNAPPLKPGYNAPPLKRGCNSPSSKAAFSASTSSIPVPPIRPSGIRMPCPILPQQRGVFDKMVEYVVGDGPSNRYALICRQCQSHNGMALREEYEYTAFRCCYCYSYNSSRKQRPKAPRLSLPSFTEQPKFKMEDKSCSAGEDESSDDEGLDKVEEVNNEESEALQAPGASETENIDTEIVTPSNDIGDVHNSVPSSEDIAADLTIPTSIADGQDSDILQRTENESVAEEVVSREETPRVEETADNIIESAEVEEAAIGHSEVSSFELIGASDIPLVDEPNTDSPKSDCD